MSAERETRPQRCERCTSPAVTLLSLVENMVNVRVLLRKTRDRSTLRLSIRWSRSARVVTACSESYPGSPATRLGRQPVTRDAAWKARRQEGKYRDRTTNARDGEHSMTSKRSAMVRFRRVSWSWPDTRVLERCGVTAVHGSWGRRVSA